MAGAPEYRPGDIRPGNFYVLAKDEEIDYSGPPWCPFNLWHHFAYSGHAALVKQCAKQLIFSEDSEQLWRAIGEKYVGADSHALAIPMRCAEFLTHWKATPRVTPAQYRKEMFDLKRMTGRIAHQLDHFFDRWEEAEPGRPVPDAECSGRINFTQLLTEDELAQFGPLDYEVWELLIGDDRGRPGIVPDLPTILRRIGELFEFEARFPPLEKPNGANAARNYFCRRLIGYFQNAGSVSPSIVATIVTIFFDQGISENEVSQQVGRHPSGRKPSRLA